MKLFLLTITSFISAWVLAQKTPQVMIETRFVETKLDLAANLGIDLAIGDFSKTHSVGPSVGLGAYFKLSNHIMGGIQLDENYFLGKKISGTGDRFHGENILRLTTTVLVRNSSNTILLGLNAGVAHISTKGFSERSFTGGVSVGVPIFGKLPILGNLFSSKKHTAAKLETIIFISPTIVKSTGE